MNNTLECNTFDTLCSAWENQLEIMLLKCSDYKNNKKSADDLLNNLLKETWLECEKFFKCSQKPSTDIKLLANSFCLHLMDQLISTHKKLYDIRFSKSRKNESLVDTQIFDMKEGDISCNDTKVMSDSLFSKDMSTSSNYMINSAECLEDLQQQNIVFCNHSDSHLAMKPGKKGGENIKKSHSFTHLYSISNYGNHKKIDTDTDKDKIAFEQFCRSSKEENIKQSVDIKSTNQRNTFFSSEEGSTKIEVDSYINVSYSDSNGSGVSVATCHQSSPSSVLKPVYTKCKTETINTLPFLLECKPKTQWGSSYSSFPNATSLTTLKDKSKPRQSMLRLLPKKIKPFHLFPIKKSPF